MKDMNHMVWKNAITSHDKRNQEMCDLNTRAQDEIFKVERVNDPEALIPWVRPSYEPKKTLLQWSIAWCKGWLK